MTLSLGETGMTFPPLDTSLAFGLPGGWEWVILLVIGLLVFGRRLPEVGRSLGKSIVEFKRGIKDIQDDIEDESSRPAPPPEIEDKSSDKPEISEASVGGEEKNPYAAVQEDEKK